MMGPTPIAASSVLRGPLLGPPVNGEVVGAGPCAAYVRLPPGPVPRIVGLLCQGSVPLPLGCLLPDGEPVPPLEPGQPVAVGSGEIRVGGHTWRITRWWAPPRVRPGSISPCQRSVSLLTRMRASRGEPLPTIAERALDRAVAGKGCGRPDATALIDVLGTGAGLTPAADDATAGVLLGLRAFLPSRMQRLVADVTGAAPRRTTALSAALLDLAAHGITAWPVANAVRAMGNATDVAAPFTALLDLGHSSGSDLAAGLLAAARTAHAVASEDLAAIAPRSSDAT